jgi:hypothetical protein
VRFVEDAIRTCGNSASSYSSLRALSSRPRAAKSVAGINPRGAITGLAAM